MYVYTSIILPGPMTNGNCLYPEAINVDNIGLCLLYNCYITMHNMHVHNEYMCVTQTQLLPPVLLHNTLVMCMTLFGSVPIFMHIGLNS